MGQTGNIMWNGWWGGWKFTYNDFFGKRHQSKVPRCIRKKKAVVLNWAKQYLIGSILWRSSRAVRHGLLSHGISFLSRWNNGWGSVGDSMRTELTTGCPQGCVLFIIKINFNLSLRDKVYNKIKQKQKYSPFFVFFVCLSLYWLSAVFCTLARKMKET